MDMSINNDISQIIEQFDNFKLAHQSSDTYSTAPRNIYLQSKNISIYVRKQLLPTPEGGVEYHLCLASIDISEKFQRQGVFTKILCHIEENIDHFRYITVEIIHNKHLESFLRKRGYHDSSLSGGEITLSNKPNT